MTQLNGREKANDWMRMGTSSNVFNESDWRNIVHQSLYIVIS